MPILQFKPQCLDVTQAARQVAHGAGDFIGDLDIVCAEIDVVSDQRRARADGGDAGGRMDARVTIIRLAMFFRGDLIADTFELAFAQVGEVFAVGARRRFLVEINRNL